MENTKACTKCGIEKPLSCFSKRSSSKDGLRYDCKECVALHAKSDEEKAKQSKRSAKYYAKPEVKAAKADYNAQRMLDPEFRRKREEYAVAYYSKPEKMAMKLARDRRYMAKPLAKARYKEWAQSYLSRPDVKERRIQIKHAWHRANPLARVSHEANRRARKKAAGGKHTAADIKQLFRLQRGKCACCHVSIADGYHVDHIQPLALGGSNDKANLQLLCPTCNLRKSAKHPVDFMRETGRLL